MPLAYRPVSSLLAVALLTLATAYPLSAAEPLIAKFDDAKERRRNNCRSWGVPPQG